jgi:hypothetical protein
MLFSDSKQVKKNESIAAMILHDLHHPAHASNPCPSGQGARRCDRQAASLTRFVEIFSDASFDFLRAAVTQ